MSKKTFLSSVASVTQVLPKKAKDIRKSKYKIRKIGLKGEAVQGATPTHPGSCEESAAALSKAHSGRTPYTLVTESCDRELSGGSYS